MNNIIPNQKSKKDMLLEMTDENKMDGYEKIVFYNQEIIDRLSFHYHEMISRNN